MERIWVDNSAEVVFAPKPQALCTYLDNSELWKEYIHPKNPNMNGWEFFRKDDVGKNIIMPEYTIWERTAERFKSICQIESGFLGEESPAFKLATIIKGE